MSEKKISLLGARGYVGKEVLSLISLHPHLSIHCVYSSSKAGDLVEGYSKDPELKYSHLDASNFKAMEEDAYILALPNNEAQPYIDAIVEQNPKAFILDISSDYRFDDDWQYRIPELSPAIQRTKISNPGCYATAMQLMLAPIKDHIEGFAHCFGVSGYSGAGATPNPRNNLELLNDNVLAYSLISHIHESEVRHHMYDRVQFVPHVGQFFRGIILTGNFTLTQTLTREECFEAFKSFYTEHSLIEVQAEPPHLQQVVHTHKAIVGGFQVDAPIKRLTFCCVIDNLLKGAATQAVQNLNSAFGWDDNLGIS